MGAPAPSVVTMETNCTHVSEVIKNIALFTPDTPRHFYIYWGNSLQRQAGNKSHHAGSYIASRAWDNWEALSLTRALCKPGEPQWPPDSTRARCQRQSVVQGTGHGEESCPREAYAVHALWKGPLTQAPAATTKQTNTKL